MASAQPPEPTAATMLACPPRSDQGALTCASLCRIRRSVRIGARFEPGVRTEESLAGGCARGATSTAGALGSAPSVRPQSSASVGRLDEQEQQRRLEGAPPQLPRRPPQPPRDKRSQWDATKEKEESPRCCIACAEPAGGRAAKSERSTSPHRRRRCSWRLAMDAGQVAAGACY